MATTMISPAGDLGALDHYIGGIAAKDADSPTPTERVEFASTIGNCTPETFVEDVRRNAERFGKQKLKHEAYHAIISQAHEEADPLDPQAGHRQHGMARALFEARFPGHMAKLVTQRDNGRWIEAADGERMWESGKWHTHAIIANVSSREAVLEMAGGTERRYKAGRAIDGAMKDIHAIRHGPGGTDALILEHFGYDNSAYVEACRKASAGRGERATTRDMADRAERGYSSHDEVRVRLREARALATSWEDYTARLEADAVWTRVTGKSGVSYAWIGEDGVEHAASARSRKGRDGLGNDFTKATVEEQCALNAERIAAGEALEAPERVMVQAPVAPAERPVPVYLAPDGRPPWEREVDEYGARVRTTGGTVEQQARERIDLALEDAWVTDRDHLIAAAPDHGVEVIGRTDEPLVALDTTDGRIVFEAGHLGDEYAGDRLDRRIEIRRKERDRDERDSRDRNRGRHFGSGGAPGRGAGRRDAGAGATERTVGTRVERVDGAALATLSAEVLRRTAEQRPEQHDRGVEHIGGGGVRAAGQQSRRGDGRRADRSGRGAETPGRGPGREARTGTPLRDEAVRREPRRSGAGRDRERD